MIYKPVFDNIPPEEIQDAEQAYYDEVIVYDGGGVDDGDRKDN